MRILHIGIFADHCLGGDIVFHSGLAHNGHRVTSYDYRCRSRVIGVDQMNREAVALAQGYDMVFIGKGELLRPESLAAMRQGGALTVIWYGDMRPSAETWLTANLRQCDFFFMTSAGDVLRHYYRQGKPGKAAFFLNPSDPGLPPRFASIPRSVSRPLFSGTLYPFQCEERRDVYEYLVRRGDIDIIGSPKRIYRHPVAQRIYERLCPTEYLRGKAYIERIIRCRFGIGVSAFQNVRYYSSDRLTHYLTFGKLYLAYRFPGCEDLFRHGQEIVYFDDLDQLERYIQYYLDQSEEAEQIGSAGQRKTVEEYNSTRMVKMMFDIIETGTSYEYPWVEVVG
jgi:hypothetical protein